jgi:hypothetical protein
MKVRSYIVFPGDRFGVEPYRDSPEAAGSHPDAESLADRVGGFGAVPLP